jgi:hypothetical protein
MIKRKEYCIECKSMIAQIGVICGNCKVKNEQIKEWTHKDNEYWKRKNQENLMWYKKQIYNTKKKLGL